MGTDLRVRISGDVRNDAFARLIDLDGNLIIQIPVFEGINMLIPRGVQPGVYIVEYGTNGLAEQVRVIVQDLYED